MQHVTSAPGHLEDSAGQALREQTDSKESRPDVGRTSSFPLTLRPARSPCHPNQGTPGARVSKVMVSSHANGPPPCTSKIEEAEVMVQGNDHHQQSSSYRASPLPMIGENDVDSGRVSTRGAQEKAQYSHTASVGGMPRGGAESGHARSGESRFGRGGTHARHTPPANMTCSDAAFETFPDVTEGWKNHFRSRPLRFVGLQVQKFQVLIFASSSGVETRRENGLPGSIPAAARRRCSTGLASTYYGGSGVLWGASAPY